MRKALILILFTGCVMFLQAQKQIVLATYTYSTNNRLQNLEPLANYLSEKTGRSFVAVSYPTVPALIQAIVNDSVDFAMMNTAGYLTLQRNYAGVAIPFINLDMGSSTATNYAGCLIVNRQAGINSIAGLATIANKPPLLLVNSSSTSGNLVPRLLLNAQGIAQPDNIFEVKYLGSHRKTAEEIMKIPNAVAGCGCAEIDSVRKYAPFDKKVLVLDSLNDIPLGPIIYRSNTDTQLVAGIASLLTNLHSHEPALFKTFCAGWTEFKQAVRFKKVSDGEYDRFRRLFGDNEALWKMIE